MRSMATVKLLFGELTIEFKTYLAASEEKVEINKITKDGNKIALKCFDSVTNKPVDPTELSPGFEISKGKFIRFTEDELKNLGSADDKNNFLEILEVTKKTNLKVCTVEKFYYLAPNKDNRAYRLLYKALKDSRKALVCKWYSRGKNVLVALHAEDSCISMWRLFYAAEVRDVPEMKFEASEEPSERELELAIKFLDKKTKEEFKHEKFTDDYGRKLKELIAEKQKESANELEKSLMDSLKGKKN